jgi:signal transduction histidine kinase
VREDWWVPVFRVFAVAATALMVLAILSAPLVPRVDEQGRRTFLLLATIAWGPYSLALLTASRRPSLALARILLLSGHLLAFGFQELVPPTAMAAVTGHFLLLSISSYLFGIRAGLLAWGLACGLSLLALTVGPSDPGLDGFTLVIFSGMGVTLAVLLDMTGREQRRAIAELHGLNRMKNTFLEAVSHDLRTPLTTVLGIASTLERVDGSLTGAERDELMASLARGARRLDRLLTDLLDVDRLSHGLLEPHLEPTDLGALADGLVRRVDLAGRDIRVLAEPVTALADPPRLERVLENLLVNAAKHTPAGTPLAIRVCSRGDEVMLAVEDQGPGVPDDLKPFVFEPFRRGADRVSPGSGIGLAIVDGFAKMQGGRVEVADRPGGGASFRVFIRRYEPADEAAGPPVRLVPQTSEP